MLLSRNASRIFPSFPRGLNFFSLPMKLSSWIAAIRPQTLAAAVAPVAIGTAMAFGDGLFHGPSAVMALLAALCIQIGTNLANDYFDFKKGADTSERKGPVRVTQAGLIAPPMVLFAAILFFVLAGLSSIYLIHRAGVCILIIAAASIVSGILYTAGPKPLGYLGLGEVFVLVFFGPVAVAGTYFTQALEINGAIILAGFGPGLLSTGILAVNNLRDIETDRKAGKRTLAVRFGRDFAREEYLFCMMAAALVPMAVLLFAFDHEGIAAASLAAFAAIPCIRDVMTSSDPAVLNAALGKTGRLLFVYSILFSAGWILWSG